MRREKEKLSKISLAESETQSGSQLQRVFAQGPMRWSVGVGAGLLVCVVVVIVYVRSQPVKGIKELQEGIRFLGYGDSPKASAQLKLAERSLTGSAEPYLAQLVFFRLGTIREKEGNLVEARQQYEASADIDGPLKAESLLAVARILALTNDESSSASYYRKLLEQYPEFPMSEIIRHRMREK